MTNTRAPAPLRRRIGLVWSGVGTAALFAAAIAAMNSKSAAAVADVAHTATVEIANFKFAPPDLTVAAGTTVTWKNADDSPHRVVDAGGGYSSPALDTEGSFAHTFTTPGVYSYICSLHPFMKGKIIVKPAAASS